MKALVGLMRFQTKAIIAYEIEPLHGAEMGRGNGGRNVHRALHRAFRMIVNVLMSAMPSAPRNHLAVQRLLIFEVMRTGFETVKDCPCSDISTL